MSLVGLTMPMHFFRIFQTLKLFLEIISAGSFFLDRIRKTILSNKNCFNRYQGHYQFCLELIFLISSLIAQIFDKKLC